MENCANIGQLNYYGAKISQMAENYEDYEKYLNSAIANRDTLFKDLHEVMAELETFKENFSAQ